MLCCSRPARPGLAEEALWGGTNLFKKSEQDYIKELSAYIESATSPAESGVVVISFWFGRLGNQLIQLANAILTAERRHIGRVQFPSESVDLLHLPETGILELPFGDAHLRIEHTFLFYVPFEVDKADQLRVLQRYVLPRMRLPLDLGITHRTAVVHMRSGDMFHPNPHSAYMPTPASFFIKVIRENRFTDVVVVTETDKANPVLGLLQRKFPFLRIQAASLTEDVGTLLSAENLITGIGTFAETVPLLSKRLRTWHWCNVWRESHNFAEFPDNKLPFDVYVYEPEGFMSSWHGTPEELKQVLEFPEDQLRLRKRLRAVHTGSTFFKAAGVSLAALSVAVALAL